MNKTVSIVNEWAAFEEQHPDADIEDFCRHYLLAQKEKMKDGAFLGGVVPPAKSSMLTKLLVKIVRMHNVYVDLATKEIGMRQAEEFYFLSVIKNLNSPKKTEVIFHTVNELSNGLNILNSLIRQGFITEEPDVDDKRSKRVRITADGEKILKKCYQQIQKVSKMMFLEMSDDDILLTIQLLKQVEIKFSPLWQHHKTKKFQEVFSELTGDS